LATIFKEKPRTQKIEIFWYDSSENVDKTQNRSAGSLGIYLSVK